ncbi:hypothetical protein ATANTOWER_014537 [Ataeniobius toweri]|uniref:Secreted protein n=1 Tax=Ataeniobius toweri TaxID=208326 RepID=A0ABU7B800_9TELE|nr:hypothetical protein [Ataeniobius toweri]
MFCPPVAGFSSTFLTCSSSLSGTFKPKKTSVCKQQKEQRIKAQQHKNQHEEIKHQTSIYGATMKNNYSHY